jgi:hypothetical protein
MNLEATMNYDKEQGRRTMKLKRLRDAMKILILMRGLRHVSSGGKFIRDEMNERYAQTIRLR